MTIDVDHDRKSDNPRDDAGRSGGKTNLSARLPKEMYDNLDSLAVVTGRSISAVLEDAFACYLKHYIGGPDFYRRRDEFVRLCDAHREQAAKDLADGTLRRYSPPRGEGHGRVGRGTSPDVRATVVRVDVRTRDLMKDAATALGISLNDVVIEALEMWLQNSATDDEVLLAARRQFIRYTQCLQRSFALPAEVSGKFRALYEDEVPIGTKRKAANTEQVASGVCFAPIDGPETSSVSALPSLRNGRSLSSLREQLDIND